MSEVPKGGEESKQHGCVLYSINFPPLDIEVANLPKYPPDPSLKDNTPYSLAPDSLTPDPIIVSKPSNPEWNFLEPALGQSSPDPDKPQSSSFQFRDFVPSIFNRKPLRILSDIPQMEKLTSIAALSHVVPTAITVIIISGQAPDPNSSPKTGGSGSKSLCKMLSTCINTEVLVLRNIGIESLSSLNLPKLRHCDLAENKIKSITDCETFAKKSQRIEVLNLVENPVTKKPDFFSRIIGTLPLLEVLNEKEISVEVRCKCAEALTESNSIENVNFYRWELSLCTIPQVKEMRLLNSGWHPETLTKLVLQEQNLQSFHVGPFIKLTHLDLQGNLIREIRGTGLERLQNLAILNLSKNNLHLRESLLPLSYLSKLSQLFLAENKFDNKDWTLWVIYETKNLPGTNRIPGLNELDGRKVTFEERIKAVELLTPKSSSVPQIDIPKLRWDLAIRQFLGQAQLRDANYIREIKALHLSGLGLSLIDIKCFVKLESLDLSNNDLTQIEGLEGFKLLRIIDLSGNPKLKLPPIIQSLSQHTTLQSLAFGMKEEGHKRNPERKSYRKKVLNALLFKNPTLVVLDGICISVNERALAFAASGPNVETPEVEKYRFHLALTISANNRPKTYQPNGVGIGMQYDPEKVTALRSMNDAGLRSDYCNLAMFKNIVELDLSRNKLKDLLVMGLQLLTKLRALDVSFNRIETPLDKIAELLNGLNGLTAVALRENPIMKTHEDRLKLISMLPAQRLQANPALRIIDTDITIDERITALQSNNSAIPLNELEQLRFDYAMLFRIPQGDKRLLSGLQVLDLRRMGLAFADLSQLPMLRALLLRGNRFTTFDNVKGISELRSLVVLDIRDNLFSDINSLAAIVSRLASLQSVGISGNRFTNKNNETPREQLIKQCPPLWHSVRFSFGSVDNEEITVTEIFQSAISVDPKAASSPTKELFKFKVALLRRVPIQASLESITELKLDNCSLTQIAFIEMPHLVRLSLSRNEIKNDDLLHSGIDKLFDLRAFDISYNKIKDKSAIKKVIGNLPLLEALWLIPNPCFLGDSADTRDKILLLLHNLPLRLLDSRPVTSR